MPAAYRKQVQAAIKGSKDVEHSSGFYSGILASNVLPQSYVDTTVEIDVYAGYKGSVPSVEGLGLRRYNLFQPKSDLLVQLNL